MYSMGLYPLVVEGSGFSPCVGQRCPGALQRLARRMLPGCRLLAAMAVFILMFYGKLHGEPKGEINALSCLCYGYFGNRMAGLQEGGQKVASEEAWWWVRSSC